jgi:4-amino-4-deoxy-L-arabinose transferase-like glycosyltransferase
MNPVETSAAKQTDNRAAGLILALLLLGTLLKGVGWSLLVFPFDAPDEPSHFTYLMQLRTYHTLPVVIMPDTATLLVPPSTPRDPATLDLLARFQYKANDFRAQPYESAQPPLFYTVAALLAAPLDANRLVLLYAGRLAAVLCGVLAVAACWGVGRALWPARPLLVWGLPAALSLHPQFTFVTATVTNDAALLAVGAALLALWAAGLRAAAAGPVAHPWRWAGAAGLLTGLGLLTKLPMLATIPATLLWLVWLVGGGHGAATRRRALPAALAGSGGLLLLTGPWVLRNLAVYGEPTGNRAQLDLAHHVLLAAAKLPLDQPTVPFQPDFFVRLTFTSFWSSYAWLATLLPPWPYWVLLALSATALLGGLLAGRRDPAPAPGLPLARRRLVVLAIVAALTAAADLLVFNIFVDVQPQGRYLFVALAPLLLLLLLGLTGLTRWPRVNAALALSLLGFMALIQLWSIPILLDRWQILNQCLTNC